MRVCVSGVFCPSGGPSFLVACARAAGCPRAGGHRGLMIGPVGDGVGEGVRAPYSPRLRNGSYASRSDGQRNLLELQALHPAQPSAPILYSDCTLLYTGRSLDHRNPTGAQRASSARSVSPVVCGSACLPVTPRTHAPHRHTKRGPPPHCTT